MLSGVCERVWCSVLAQRLAKCAADDEELRGLLRDRAVDQLRRRAEASGASPQMIEAAEQGGAADMLDLVITLEVWDVPIEVRRWDPAAELQEVRDAVRSTESYLALRASADVDAPRLQVPPPARPGAAARPPQATPFRQHPRPRAPPPPFPRPSVSTRTPPKTRRVRRIRSCSRRRRG